MTLSPLCLLLHLHLLLVWLLLLLPLLLLLLLLQDMLRRLLAFNPKERLNLEDALAHAFLQKPFDGHQLADTIEETFAALEKH